MLRTLAAVLSASAAAAAAASTFLGAELSPGSSSSVNILALNADGTIQRQLSSIPIGAGERLDVDMFRCVPEGAYCSFLTTDASGNSFLYNLSDVTGSEADKAAYPVGYTAFSLHVDFATGITYSASATPQGGIAIVATDETSLVLIDVTSSFPAGAVLRRGSATHCSDKKRMWVQAAAPGGNATVVQIDLAIPAVTAAVNLSIAGFDALWAECDDQTDVNTVGGSVFTPATSSAPAMLSYGVITGTGRVVLANTGTVPAATPAVVPAGLLTMGVTSPFFATLYPAGASPSSPAPGMLASFGAVAGSPFTFSPLSYFLAGAARYA